MCPSMLPQPPVSDIQDYHAYLLIKMSSNTQRTEEKNVSDNKQCPNMLGYPHSATEICITNSPAFKTAAVQ